MAQFEGFGSIRHVLQKFRLANEVKEVINFGIV